MNPQVASFSDLSKLVDPSSVVLVGASDRRDSIGGRTLYNLIEESAFTGELYLVNPSRGALLGRPCWPDVAALPGAPDLALVAVPAAAVIGVLNSCATRGVRFAIVLSSGFGEAGEEGKAMQDEMKRIAQRSGMRIYGPNCPGLSNINRKTGFTFSPAFKLDLRPGPIGLATQGGGLGRTFLQAMERGIGVGLWCSAGNEVDLDVSDFVHHMALAPDIRVIAVLLEGIKDGARFIAAVTRAAEQKKPVVVLKIGKSDYGIKAAQSHTAAISGSAEVNSAVFRQLGVIEVDDIDELVDTAWLLSRALPKGDEQIAVYCSSGGTAALCADLVGVAGLPLASFSDDTIALLASRLPAFAAISNPVDTTADVLADMSIIDFTLEAVTRDPSVALVINAFPMEYGTATTQCAESVVRVQAKTSVPIVPVWMSDRTGEGFHAMAAAGLAPIRSIGKAVKAIARWRQYGQWLQNRDPAWRASIEAAAGAAQLCSSTHALSEVQGKAWLAEGGVRLLQSAACRTLEEASSAAERFGFPVVAKVISAAIAHKSDAGGVKVDLRTSDEVATAWEAIHRSVAASRPDANIDGILIEKMAHREGMELLVGVHRDPVFGHVLTFGAGGLYVEVMSDVARRLLPLTRRDAEALIRDVRCFALLDGARGRPRADVAALVELLLTISDLVVRHAGEIEEVELNPVWVGAVGEGAYPLDVVIVRR